MTNTTVRLFLTGCLAILVVACGHGKGIPPEGADHAEDHALVGSDYQAGVDAYNRGDYDTALKEFRPLAVQGDPKAQNKMGVLYVLGEGVPQDYTEAVKWYRLAAEQGEAAAQYNLGLMYNNGQGVPQDYTEAVRWFRLGADQGEAAAQFNLGVMYFSGHGVARNYIQAYMWASLAAAQGNENAVKVQELLEKEMPPEQLAEAQRLAREWTAKGK